MKNTKDNWESGDPYEYFMGRWSKMMALEFLNWLNLPKQLSWMDIGCGTGALSETIFQHYKPSHLTCIDPSEEFLILTKKAK
jgi:ubiquinone/menaquinone biosynthesis C-methylase UbiE